MGLLKVIPITALTYSARIASSGLVHPARHAGPAMEWLLRALAATDCPMSCPHGRPIAMHYSTREILKAFHRI